MDVLVVGGTGFIGTHLCGELVERGHDVTALSRNPEGEGLPERVETAMGDVTSYDSIRGAFEGKDAAVNLVALSPLFKPKGGNSKHFEVHRDGTANVVQACEDEGVPRLTHMSALDADPNGDTAYLRSKGEAENIVTDSDLDWTVFRPSVVFGEGGEFVSFTKKLKGLFAPGVPVYPLPGGGKTRFQPIWVGDLVPMLADSLEAEEHVGKTYEIGGPEVLTLAEVARLSFEAEGKDISIVGLPMALAGVGLSVAGKVPGFPMGADQYRSLKMDNTTADNDVAAFGVETAELRTLGAYLGVA
jgi:NADH dehydrogenase